MEYVNNTNLFFKKVQKELEPKEQPINPKMTIDHQGKIHWERLRDALIQSGRRGDVLLALPHHGWPWLFLNVKHSQFMVGHAAVLTKQVDYLDEEKTKITMEAQVDGVMDEDIDYWSVRCYIMGIQRTRWRWAWFNSGWVREPVGNPWELANWAESFKGRGYVNWYEFLVAKWVAPSRFTCTTLVWWCSKKAYGINVSSWWSTMVSPSGLFLDGATYIRREVK